MKYGVVKNGKILFKYAFKEDQSEALAAVKNSVALPLEESPGKGAVKFVLQADKIVMQYDKYEEFVVKFGAQEPVEVSDKAKEFLLKHFGDAQKQVKRDKVFQTQWRIGNAELKKMRKLVWERWEQYVTEFIASKFTAGDDNEDDGVSFNDLILHSFFNGDWPIQSKNGRQAMNQGQINRAKGEMREALVLKREAVEFACMPQDPTVPAWTLAIENSAKWVLDGVV